MTNQFVRFELDGEALADLVNICAKENKTPSEVISGIIRDKASACGLILKPAQSA